MSDEYLDIAVNGVLENQCVLFLGPNFAADAQGQKIHQQLKTYLKNEQFDLVEDLDNLFVFKELNPSNIRKITLHAKMRHFYNTQVQASEMYQKIALIPFQAVITCTHDLLLKEAFQKQGIDLDFQYYAQKVNPDYNQSDDLPILYNVLGNLEDKESLLNTYDRFSDFVIAMLSDSQMISTNLKHVISRASVFIFIGFNLETWYFPLVIRKLKFYNESGIVTGDVAALVNMDNFGTAGYMGQHKSDNMPSFQDPISDNAKRMYYPIELTFWEKDTNSVLNSIYEALDKRGKLRKKPVIGNQTHLKVKDLVSQNRVEDALKLLMEAFDKSDKEAVNALIMLSGRYNRFKQDQMLNILSIENAKQVMAEIVYAILQYADQLAAFFSGEVE
jgi:hypothetical protein